MQQTADAVVETKDQTDVESDLETTLVSGSSYSFFAVAEIAGALAVVAVAMTAAYGSSSCCSSAVASATTEVAADADATTTATRI